MHTRSHTRKLHKYRSQNNGSVGSFFGRLPEEVRSMVFEEILKDATQVIRPISKRINSRTFRPERMNRNRKGIVLNKLALVSKFFANELLPRFDRLPRVFEIDTRFSYERYLHEAIQEFCRHHEIMPKFNLVPSRILRINSHTLFAGNSSTSALWFHDLGPIGIDATEIGEVNQASLSQSFLSAVHTWFEHYLAEFRSRHRTEKERRLIFDKAFVISTPMSVLHATGEIEHEESECYFIKGGVGTISRYESSPHVPNQHYVHAWNPIL